MSGKNKIKNTRIRKVIELQSSTLSIYFLHEYHSFRSQIKNAIFDCESEISLVVLEDELFLNSNSKT